MKRSFFLSFLLIVAVQLVAQETVPVPLTEQDYLAKSRRQKTAAWILTGAGAAGLLATLTADASQTTEGVFVTLFSFGTVEPEYKSYTVPYLLSAAALAGGITLFFAAGKNRRKAWSLNASSGLKMEWAPTVQGGRRGVQTFPALALRLGFQ